MNVPKKINSSFLAKFFMLLLSLPPSNCAKETRVGLVTITSPPGFSHRPGRLASYGEGAIHPHAARKILSHSIGYLTVPLISNVVKINENWLSNFTKDRA